MESPFPPALSGLCQPVIQAPCDTVPMTLSAGLIHWLEKVHRTHSPLLHIIVTDELRHGRHAQSWAYGKGVQNPSGQSTLTSLHEFIS